MLKSPRDLLLSTVKLYREHLWLFLGFAAWLILPVAAFLILTAVPDHPLTTLAVMLAFLAQIVVSLWIVVCLIRITLALQTNKLIDQKDLSREALRRIQPLLAVALLQVLIVLGGFLLLVVPALIFWVWYSQAQMVTVVEGQRPIASLSTSRALVRGRFWSVLWRLVAGPVVIGLGYAFVLGSVLLVLATLLGLDTSLLFTEHPPVWAQLIETLADIFVIPLFIVYATLLYQNLKETPLEDGERLA